MKSFWRWLGSLRLAVILFLALAFFSAVGTFIPQYLSEAEYYSRYPRFAPIFLTLGFDHYYIAPFYTGLLMFFLANLIACSLDKTVESWRNFRGRGRASTQLSVDRRSFLESSLRANGFRIVSSKPLKAVKRGWVFLVFPLVHLAPPIILLGGLINVFNGYTLTKHVHVEKSANEFDDPRSHGVKTLPFTVEVKDFNRIDYPLELQVEATLPDGGKTGEFEVRVGSAFKIPSSSHRAVVDSFLLESPEKVKEMVYRYKSAEGWSRPIFFGKDSDSPLKIIPLAFHDPEVRRVESNIALLASDGKELASGLVAVNHPLTYKNHQISITNWDKDKFGFMYIGLQVVHDPGLPMVWVGFAAISLGIIMLSLNPEGGWAREEDGQILLKHNKGRRGWEKILSWKDDKESS